MELVKLNTYCAISHIKEHLKIKNKLLELIDSVSQNKLVDENDKISNTDWHLPKTNERRIYSDLFFETIMPYLNETYEKMFYKEFHIVNYWFQQYLQNDTHHWHNHGDVAFSNVYFLELPNNEQTEFYDIKTNEIISDLDIKEGDLISFPGIMHHRSKPLLSNERKSIIAFNINVNETLI